MRGVRALAALTILAATWSPAEAQTPDTLAEPVLLELRLGQIGARTVPALRLGDEALLPLLQFFEMAEVRATADTTGAVHATLQPGDVPVLVSAREPVARAGRRMLPVRPDQIRFRDGELYLDRKSVV